MAIIVSDEKKYTPHPTGLWQAVCCDVEDLGVIEVKYNGETKKQHKIRLVWQSEERNPDNADKPFLLSKRYTASLNDKATLRKDLESWRGRPFTQDELRGFDLEMLIGANAFINVIHVEREGKTYSNVASISPIKKGIHKIGIIDYTRAKDRTESEKSEESDPGPQEIPAGPYGGVDMEDVPFIRYDVPCL